MSKALAILLFAMACSLAAGQRQDGTIRVSASDAQPEFEPMGALDGDRFQSGAHNAWKGKPGAASWWWEAHFPTPRTIGGLLQIEGDHGFVLQNAPRDYVWEWSDDGEHWRELVHERNEQRTFRVHRFSNAVTAAYLRMRIERVEGAFPTIREVELFGRQLMHSICVPFRISMPVGANRDALPAIHTIPHPRFPSFSTALLSPQR